MKQSKTQKASSKIVITQQCFAYEEGILGEWRWQGKQQRQRQNASRYENCGLYYDTTLLILAKFFIVVLENDIVGPIISCVTVPHQGIKYPV